MQVNNDVANQQPATDNQYSNLKEQTKNGGQFLSLLKKFWYVLILIIVLIASLILRILTQQRTTSNKTKPTITKIDISTSENILPESVEVVFTGEKPSLPQKLNVYQVEFSSLQTTANLLANTFGLTQSKNFPALWLSKDSSTYFSLSEEDGIIEYGTESALKPTPGINIENAVSAAQKFLAQLPTSEVVLKTDQAIFLNNSPEPKQVFAEKAYYVSIPFSYVIDKYPLVSHSLASENTSVLINSSGVVTKAIFTAPIKTATQTKQEPALKIEAAIKEVEKGNAVVTNIYNPQQASIIEPDDLQTINLAQIEVEYRHHQTSLEAIPYYRFSGTGITKNKESIVIEVLTPAI